MGELLTSLRGGIARFAFAWMVPTAAAVGLFWAFCVPELAASEVLPAVTGSIAGAESTRAPLVAVGIAVFITFAVAILLAYSSQFIYRILEGYHLPSSVQERLRNRQLRQHLQLTKTIERLDKSESGRESPQYGLALEKLGLFPTKLDRVLPTRLGNALRAMERYGSDTYEMDSQQFWFELIGSVDEPVRRETEEARAMVDLFVAATAVATLLGVASLVVASKVEATTSPLLLGVLSLGFVPIAYRGAIRNMKDWHNSVRALINLGRIRVAHGMGMVLPKCLEDERRMWQAATGVLMFGDSRWLPWLDVFRREITRDDVVKDPPLTPNPYGETSDA